MSAIALVYRKFNWKASLALAIPLVVLALLAHPLGLPGEFWMPSPDMQAPIGGQTPLFLFTLMITGAILAIFFLKLLRRPE